MKEPLVSCLVPVLNGERFLRETLESVLAQTYRPIEIIVVDDGSTDGTAAVVAGFGDSVRYHWQPNGGLIAARNQGVKLAGGEFVAFLDADDLWHAEKLARQVARLDERPDVDLCFTRFQNFWVSELADEERQCQDRPLSQPSSGWSPSTLLARRTAFVKFGLFRGRPDEPGDMVWFLRAAEHGAVIEVLPEILMSRRIHQRNMSREKGLDLLFPVLKAWRDYQRRRGDKPPHEGS